jgi:glycine/D-amino acid oxidase-like deaminating enzyme
VTTERAEVVVVGAGAIGAALALRLGRAGVRVLVVDAGLPGSGTSGASFAWFNASSKVRLRYPIEYFELNRRAVQSCYQLANDLVDGNWLHPIGYLEIASDHEVAQLRLDVAEMLRRDYPARLIDEHQAAELEPNLRVPAGSIGAYYPHEGWIDGPHMVQSLLHEFKLEGGRVIESDPVSRLDLRSGRTRSATLASGLVLEADNFVLAAGIDTPELATQVDVNIPLVERNSHEVAGLLAHYRADPAATTLSTIVHVNGALIRPNGRGRLLVGPTHGDSELTLATSEDVLRQQSRSIVEHAAHALPLLKQFDFDHAVVGARALPVDRVSIVGPAPGVDGLYVAVTHSGITLAPHIAELVTSEIVEGGRQAALEPFRPDRFVRKDPPTAVLAQ